MTRVAILIPAFDAADTIAATLQSAQEQGSHLAELSAVYLADDGSRDDTVAAAKAAWHAAEPPLHVLRAERNLGQWTNVNRAMASMGPDVEWVLLLHADDLAKPNWVERMLSRIRVCGPEVASVCSSWEDLYADGHVAGGQYNESLDAVLIRGTDQAVRDTIVSGCWWHISGCAIRLRAFEDVGGFSPLLAVADWDWLLRCLARGWQVEYVPTTLIQYRQHERSVSSASIQRDQDIRESLGLIHRYQRLLTLADLCRLHFRQGEFATRRVARAVLTRQPGRALARGRTIGLVAASLSRSLLQAAARTARTDRLGSYP